MTNSELIEELAKAHIQVVYGCPVETLALQGGAEFQLERSRKQVRAVLARLADLGMTLEMRTAAHKEKYIAEAFTASLRALADE